MSARMARVRQVSGCWWFLPVTVPAWIGVRVGGRSGRRMQAGQQAKGGTMMKGKWTWLRRIRSQEAERARTVPVKPKEPSLGERVDIWPAGCCCSNRHR